MRAPLQRDGALQAEDLRSLPRVALLYRLEPSQGRIDDSQVGTSREVPLCADLGRCEKRVAGEHGAAVAPGRVFDVAERVLADVGRSQAEEHVERDAAVDDQLTADVFRGVLIDQELVAVNLRGVVELRGERDVLGSDRATSRMLESIARSEILEVTVRRR